MKKAADAAKEKAAQEIEDAENAVKERKTQAEARDAKAAEKKKKKKAREKAIKDAGGDLAFFEKQLQASGLDLGQKKKKKKNKKTKT